ncbi:gluconate transporter [Mycolicibacterium moriokaense]|jgi:GntP family gluconate:H+ symporter|uniref:Gluconate:H+ symporter, GntP family protein n=1 Tax=Mycolicibacterium moriokaense TaxID=39691 RepID=A0AAD1HCP1_9MYCO|nr:gluconate:H+ symporter [Mycolicibacterium moriokaense]MCV7038288.1 gluconate transporter [Mycolicibacterium moriokaense]ORB24271.1 gluconate transporter [Mycolicibacterium moriokaense]BBX02594.1 gluconate:H+ symporter, GntP family protein [Mycolicibacterium moriokaense]
MTSDIGAAITVLAAEPELAEPVAAGWQLIVAALAGIALIVVLITVAKLHPFLALIFGAITVGIVAQGWNNLADVFDSFSSGFGTTAAGVGILIALGAMFAKLLADSGGADEIVDTIVGHASPRALPWAMALVGSIIGLPMFFEIGLVLLMPVIYLVAKRSQLSLITVGIPALAGLSAMHGLVPPHPGPLTAIDLLGADLGITLAMGVAVAIPTVIVAGPLFGRLAGKWVVLEVPDRFDADDFARNGGGATAVASAEGDTTTATQTVTRQRPSFAITMFSVLLPVALMMGKALADIFIADETNVVRQTFDLLGRPLVALLIAVVVGIFTLGRGAAMTRDQIVKCIESSLPPVAGIILIVAAGGGFKQVLVDTGIGTMLADWAKTTGVSTILLAWILAVLIRLATGSATVATITASALMLGLVEGMSSGQVSLIVLAVGAGSVFFSHVNDAGFWLVKEYFGMSVGQTIKSWSLMETVLSVVGLVLVLLLGIFV